jgi:hypothetical protein
LSLFVPATVLARDHCVKGGYFPRSSGKKKNSDDDDDDRITTVLKSGVGITCDDLHHDMKSIPLIVMMVSYLASLLTMITETTSITTTILTTISKQKRRTYLLTV